MKLLVGTQNPGKLREINVLLTQDKVEITDLATAGLADLEVQETGTTFAENAFIKAKAFAEAAHMPALGDDSGLEVTTLGGKPGVYSKRYAPGSDEDRYRFLLKEMTGQADRSASFKTVLCLYDPETKKAEYFEGEVHGRISQEPRGTDGFGYDPVFIPDGHIKTFAELTLDEKNQLSHRARALAKLQKYLLTPKI